MDIKFPNGPTVVRTPPELVNCTREDEAVFLLGWIWGRLQTPGLLLEERVQDCGRAIEAFYQKHRESGEE